MKFFGEKPSNSGVAEKPKSPSEIRYEELRKDAVTRPLGSEREAILGPTPDELGISRDSMRGVYSNSGDPEKVAMLRLWEAKGNIDMIASAMVSQESHGDLTAEWAADKQEQTEKVKPILDVLGISLPNTLQEARSLLGTIVNFENWTKLSEHYKKAENWLEDLNKEMVKDGDKHEKYSNEKLKGIEAEFISVAGEITVVLRKYNPSTESEVSADQYEKKFTKDQRNEAETFFAELKNHLDVTAMEYDDEETSFKKAEALFS